MGFSFCRSFPLGFTFIRNYVPFPLCFHVPLSSLHFTQSSFAHTTFRTLSHTCTSIVPTLQTRLIGAPGCVNEVWLMCVSLVTWSPIPCPCLHRVPFSFLSGPFMCRFCVHMHLQHPRPGASMALFSLSLSLSLPGRCMWCLWCRLPFPSTTDTVADTKAGDMRGNL